MEIFHRISFGSHEGLEGAVKELSIPMTRTPGFGDYYLLTIEIEESDPRWPKVAQLIVGREVPDFYNTTFTPQEILAAEWVRAQPLFEQGYPQPEDSWNTTTYANACRKCGAGYEQVGPFCLAKEPRLGRNSFLSLYWTHTLFATPRVFQVLTAEGVRGFERREALIHRIGRPSEVVSQLFVPTIARPGVAPEDRLQPERCQVCGLTKYAYHKRGYMRYGRSALRSDVDLQMTDEWFGSGHMAFREFLVSKRLASLILEHGWRGVALKPLQLV